MYTVGTFNFGTAVCNYTGLLGKLDLILTLTSYLFFRVFNASERLPTYLALNYNNMLENEMLNKLEI